jgi:hypothetical protein
LDPVLVRNRLYPFLPTFFGFYCGFLIGASLDDSRSVLGGKILYAVAILVIGFFWRSIDTQAHRHHLERWSTIRRRGKVFFVFARYLVLRGGLFFFLFGTPAFFDPKFALLDDSMLPLIIGVLVVMMVFLGFLEWRYCEQDYEILAIKNAADEARISAAMHN